MVSTGLGSRSTDKLTMDYSNERLLHITNFYSVGQKGHTGDLQDGRGVRRGDHLPPHRYIKSTSTCGTTPTEHRLNTGRRPQTSQKARNCPCTWVGQKKKEKTETKE